MAGRVSDKSDSFENLQNYACDADARRVFLHSPIGTTVAEEGHQIGTEHVVRSLLYLAGRGSEPITLWVNTPGGEIHEMWAIIDVMESISCAVNTVAFGNVSSAGCLIVACGTGKRYATKHASFMWHAGSTGVGYIQWTEAVDRMAWEIRENERWLEHMARRTRPPGCKTLDAREAFWKEQTRGREFWLEAGGMKKHGIVDEILTRRSGQDSVASCASGARQ
jgi:ATP-dependent protease ClpP protease subunit